MLRDHAQDAAQRDPYAPEGKGGYRPRDLPPLDVPGPMRLGVAINHLTMRRRSCSQIALISGSCGAIVGAAVWAGQATSGSALFLTSLVSSAVLIATAPRLRQCHPFRIFASHVIAVAVGIAVRSLTPASPIAVAASVALALTIILVLDALHPPALANAGFAFASDASALDLLALTTVTVAVLASCAVVLSLIVQPSINRTRGLATAWRRRRE